jgi:phage-related protein
MFNELFKGVKVDVKFDVDQVSLARMAAMSKEMENVGRSSDDVGGRLGFLQGLLASLGDGFDHSSGRIASFDNFLRGLMSLGIALFLNQLILLAGAAAGALGALASSAAYAGSALGGSFAAGLMQALPVLGIFAAGLLRLKAVFDAVKQAQLLQQQESYKGAQEAHKQTSANDSLISANERVANATKAVTDAQEKLNQARDDARQKLLDLILQEQGLRLSLDQNTASQRAAISRGQTGALPELFLQRRSTQNQLGRVSADISQRTTGTAPEVKQAEDALEKAKQGVGDAQRDVKKAQEGADIAAAGITAAAGKLDFLLSQMSGAEKELFKTLSRLQNEFRKASQYVTEPLIKAFNDALLKIEKLIGDKKILNAFRGLASEMAAQGTRIFDAFTSPKMIQQFMGFIADAKKNLGPLSTIIINIGKAFISIADAAGPVLHGILTGFSDASGKVAEFFENSRKSGDLTKFFKDGLVHLQAWADLLVQIGRLFIAIAGPGGGAKTGLQLVRDMADAIGSWADKIATPGTKLNEFFNRFFKLSRQMIAAMVPVLRAIADEFNKTFTKDGLSSVQGFATFLADILIPAIGDFARTLGSITTKLGEFVKYHPEVAKIAASFLSAVLVFGVLSKVLTIFGPIISVFKFLGKYLADALGITEKLLGPMVNGARAGGLLAKALERVAGVILGPWGIAIGIFLLVAAKLGLLHNIVEALKKPFVELWNQVEPPIHRLVASFQRLWDAISKGSGAFALLKPVLAFLIDTVGDVLGSIGKAIGLVIGGIIDVIGGLIDIITGVLTGDWSLAWDGLKKIVTGAARAILGLIELLLLKGIGKLFGLVLDGVKLFGVGLAKLLPAGAKLAFRLFMAELRLLPTTLRLLFDLLLNAAKDGIPGLLRLFRSLGRTVFDAISGGFSRVFKFFRDLPSTLFDLVKPLGSKIADAFTGLGSKIMGAITKGIRDPKGAAKGFANGIIDLINTLLPNKLGPINLPDNPIPKFAEGGRVGRGFGGGDRRLILAEDGEYVIRKEAVARFGEGFMALINGGLSGGKVAGRFATGGSVSNADNNIAIAGAKINADADIGNTAHRWREMWQEMSASTRRNAQEIEGRIRDMRVNITATMGRLYRDIKDYVSSIKNAFDDRGGKIVDSWSATFDSLKGVAYDGLNYIGHEVNKALKSLGDKTLNFGLDMPTKSSPPEHTAGGTFAGGGMVGNPGERGRDAVPAWLGRGEAVLNWAHQKVVNSALWNTYRTTLPEMFKRNFAYHAGGPQTSPGFATGGGDIFNGHPSNVNPNVVKLIRLMKGKFPLVVSSTTDHSFLTTSGNPSDHSFGNAVDLSGATEIMFRAAEFVKSSGLYRSIKQGIHNPNLAIQLGKIQQPPGIFSGAVWDQHINHIHLAIVKALSGAYGLGSTIKKLAVKGGGALAGVAENLLEKARTAANKFLEDKQSVGDSDVHGLTSAGGTYDKGDLEKLWIAAGGPSSQANLAAAIALAESGGDALAHNPSGASGLWQILGQVVSGDIFDPLVNARNAVKKWRDAKGFSPWTTYTGADTPGHVPTYTKYLATGGEVQEFATGGQVQGPDGAPVGIIAHAGEWVINKLQQSKLATMLGATTGKLRDFLGFTGGPTSFAGGGDVTPFRGSVKGSNYTLPMVNPEDLAGIEREIGLVHTAIMNISRNGKVGKQVSSFLRKIRALTDQDGYLDQMGTAIETLGTHLQNSLALAQAGFVRVASGLVRRKGGPLTDAVAIANTTVVNLDKIGDALRAEMRVASRGLAETNASIRSLREGGITKGEEDKFKSLVAARAKFKSSLDDLDTKYAQNRADRYQANVDRFNAQTEAALRPSTRAGSAAELAGRIASAAGDVSGVNLASQASQQALEAQKGVLVGRAAEAARLAARNPRWQKVADDIQKQVDDLTVTITQNIAAQQKAAIDAVNTAATRRQTALNLRGRAADLLAAGGDALGAARNRIGVANDQVSSTTRQRDELLALVAKTTAGTDRYDALIDQINDLNQTIAEQTQAAKDLNFTYRQTATDIISGRSSRTTGLIGTATDIITKVGNLSGTQDTAGLLAFANQTKAVLSNGAQEIRKNITDALSDPNGAFGTSGNSVLATLSAAFTQGPGSFASALATLSPTIANLESTMSGPEKDAFDALIQSMIDNTTATLDNSQTISDLTGSITQPQGFSSSAWQWFRTAIFNGMGSVLPEYEIPQMHTGGEVTRSGVFDLQVGERVVKPGQGQGANVSITVNEAGGPVDTEWIASRVGWEFKNK